MVKVELVYIPAQGEAFQVWLELPERTAVEAVLHHSKLYELFPETKSYVVGIFGKKVALNTPVNDGDRVEVYRPLTLNPMDKRRQRAQIHKRDK